MTVGDNFTFTLTLCGNEKPEVHFEFDNNNTYISNVIKVSDHTYNYTILVFNMQARHCSMTMKYNATGYSGSIIGATKFNVECKLIC